VVSLANAAVNRARKKNPKTKCNTGRFQKQFRSARGGRERLHALIFAKSPFSWTYKTEKTHPKSTGEVSLPD
jgi:hypothetical protein